MNSHEPQRVRVKICGITNEKDARAAIACGADALGFNLYEKSRRYLDLSQHAHWIAELPPLVAKVAVLVNCPMEEARRVASHPAIDMVQFHGDEDSGYCAEFARSGHAFIKALRLGCLADIGSAGQYSTRHVLVDAHVTGAFGGTGVPIDLELAARCVQEHSGLYVIIAGGLTPSNVAETVRVTEPYAVDVASGVESAPGRKSEELLAAFIGAAKRGR